MKRGQGAPEPDREAVARRIEVGVAEEANAAPSRSPAVIEGVRFFEGAGDAGLVAQADGPADGAGKAFDRRLDCPSAGRCDDDLGALPARRFGDREADARASADDHDAPAGEREDIPLINRILLEVEAAFRQASDRPWG